MHPLLGNNTNLHIFRILLTNYRTNYSHNLNLLCSQKKKLFFFNHYYAAQRLNLKKKQKKTFISQTEHHSAQPTHICPHMDLWSENPGFTIENSVIFVMIASNSFRPLTIIKPKCPFAS